MRLSLLILALILVSVACASKEPAGPDFGTPIPSEADADTDTDTDTDTDSDTDVDQDEDGFSVADGDCDDFDSEVHPDAVELCNSIDDDCDGDVDEADAADATTWYTDGDGDGFGDEATAVLACDAPAGTVDQAGDCDDFSGAVNPDRDEQCDGFDNDCDEEVDEADALDATTWYTDEDGDGYGVTELAVVACTAPSGSTAESGDCDDEDPSIHPDLVDGCDAIDNDCDGGIDEDVAEDWFADSDSWEEVDTIDGAFPVWIGALPGEPGVWAVASIRTGDSALQPAFYEYVEGVGFERRDAFTMDGVDMDTKAATVDSAGLIWVTGRVELTPGDSASSIVQLMSFDPETYIVEEHHFGGDSTSREVGVGIAANDAGVWVAGRAMSDLGQRRATLWLFDGTEAEATETDAAADTLTSHATYNSVSFDLAGRIYLGGQRQNSDGISEAVVRGGEIDAIEDIFGFMTSEDEELNDQVRDLTTDGVGNLWFTVFHNEYIPFFGGEFFSDWRLYTGPPGGPFDVVDSFSYGSGVPSFGRSVAVHPTGVVFTTGVALDTSGGTHLVVRSGNPPSMFTSLDHLRDPDLSVPAQGSYARPAAFDHEGTVWLIEGWQVPGATTETGEETQNTRVWRLSCLEG